MNPRFREIHKAEIKRRMYHATDRRWDALYGALCAGTVLIAFGIRATLGTGKGSAAFGSFFIFLGVIFIASYVLLFQLLRRKDQVREWLTISDHAVIIAGMGISASVPSEYCLVPILAANCYATWKLWQRSKPFWRRYYFFAAREYFREIDQIAERQRQNANSKRHKSKTT